MGNTEQYYTGILSMLITNTLYWLFKSNYGTLVTN